MITIIIINKCFSRHILLPTTSRRLTDRYAKQQNKNLATVKNLHPTINYDLHLLLMWSEIYEHSYGQNKLKMYVYLLR